MDALFDGFVQEDLRRHPEGATQLGLDSGPMAWTKGALHEVSIAAAREDIAINRAKLAKLHAVGRPTLSGMDAVNYDVVDFDMAVQDELSRFPWFGRPYALSQLTGAYQRMPDFLDNQHSIATKQDADDYLSRMNAFASQMDGSSRSPATTRVSASPRQTSSSTRRWCRCAPSTTRRRIARRWCCRWPAGPRRRASPAITPARPPAFTKTRCAPRSAARSTISPPCGPARRTTPASGG